jgi:hypothetical protein
MENLSELDELNKAERIMRFRGILKDVVGVDDLFPPEDGVRVPAKPPYGPLPKTGSVALDLAEINLVLV